MSDLLIQYLVPALKTHPRWAWVFVALLVVVGVWSKFPQRWKGAIHDWAPFKFRLGARIAGLLDALVALLPTAPKVVDSLWKGVVLGQIKPTTMTRNQLDQFAATVLETNSIAPPGPASGPGDPTARTPIVVAIPGEPPR